MRTPATDDAGAALWRRYAQAHDSSTRERLIISYAPLVKSVAGRLGRTLPPHVEAADLVSAGVIGLIGALERYDPARRVRFEAFAAARIRGAMLDELRSLDWAPRSLRSKGREIERVGAVLETQLRRAPTEAEVAAALHLSLPALRRILAQLATASPAALDDTLLAAPDDDAVTRMETLQDPSAADPSLLVELTELHARLASAVAALPARQRALIVLHYHDERTLREIGRLLGITESRVSQLHRQAMVTLKARLGDEVDLDALQASQMAGPASLSTPLSRRTRTGRPGRS